MSNTVTNGVRIIVQPRYVPEQSEPAESQYLFAYHITIRNEGIDAVQLLSRHWIITNGEGKTDEVRGPGVVGYQPTLKSGEEFQYTSGCPLGTPVGTMHGSFEMTTENGEKFDAIINAFRLAVPSALN
ncbi:Co2+/Mg2+ efflux protein ApaG [Stenotrophobium rhamnosiphilum]|uniref:Protein ApaG n=1 Tax=Stenotrophobium rhamnosiphilum TaxID=2029166 RepID=A0A2T5MFT5_9GAMM|nr:Co2+/Mg2+ efflux protein ApaG [Stenotrophobium rhamnosiphilum]PTU31437.1 Co2+/Mg2+ efflux protein ApaG [Stenotrophobium rhamnosiphilum]